MRKKDPSLFTYGSAENVSLSMEEIAKLYERLTPLRAQEYIDSLSVWKAAKGRKTKSDYFTILMWARKDGLDECEAIEDEREETYADLIALERQRAQERFDARAATHQHGEACDYGDCCAYVESKRP